MSSDDYTYDESDVTQQEDNGEEDDSEVQEDDSEVQEYEFTDEENEALCRAFTLLDVDGDGVIDGPSLEQLLVSWGRMPMNEELEDILAYAKGTGCEGAPGMDFTGFRRYMGKELANTRDEDELREAFQAFDSEPPTGKLNVTELRHYLKRKGMKLTDDEIDYLFREEDYWLLDEKDIFEYEEMINKILDKPICNSQFLNC